MKLKSFHYLLGTYLYIYLFYAAVVFKQIYDVWKKRKTILGLKRGVYEDFLNNTYSLEVKGQGHLLE